MTFLIENFRRGHRFRPKVFASNFAQKFHFAGNAILRKIHFATTPEKKFYPKNDIFDRTIFTRKFCADIFAREF